MTNTHEPAFPSTNEVMFNGNITGGHSGMTLRDYFAAKAMQALMQEPEKHTVINAEQMARVAYESADAMMKARNL